ncbi:MAG: shikimate kinase [Clostridiales bacterium]|nr:shikimate kinase [Clostridiales bacterium]
MSPSKIYNSIVLCGFMGCGKSSVGRALAEKLDFSFVDTDEMITEQAGRSVAQIFADCGESGFRDLEHEIIRRAAARRRCVISTGGGVMTFERNARLLAQHGLIVHISRSFEDCYEAVRMRKNRPIAGQKSREQLFALYESRLPAYEKYAAYTLINEGTMDETADRLVSWLFDSELIDFSPYEI